MSDTTAVSVYRIDFLRGSENYPVWKVKIIDILTDQSLEEYIEDTAAAPADTSLVAAWKKKNRKALSTMRLRVSDHVLVHIANATSAKEAWQTLRNMYEAKGPTGIVLARRKFFRAQCSEDGDIEEHIRVMRGYQSELISLKQTISEADFSVTLLTSLPDSWNPFISSIPDDSLNDSTKVIARILAEVARLRERASQSTALAAVNRAEVKCYKCGKKGHIVADHYKPDFHRHQRQQPESDAESESDSESDASHARHPPPLRRRRGKSTHAHIIGAEDYSDSDDFAFVSIPRRQAPGSPPRSFHPLRMRGHPPEPCCTDHPGVLWRRGGVLPERTRRYDAKASVSTKRATLGHCRKF